MKRLATVLTMVALMMMSSLTVQAKDEETPQEKVEIMISQLEDTKRPAGKAYPDEYYIHFGYVTHVENSQELKELISELKTAVEEYNSHEQEKIEVYIEIMREDYVSVDFATENLYYIENTPICLGKVVYVREGSWKYWESSENFGAGQHGTVEGGDAVIVTRVSYLDEGGNIISTSFDDSEEIRFADLRMLHIRSIEGDDLGWIWPLSLVDPL